MPRLMSFSLKLSAGNVAGVKKSTWDAVVDGSKTVTRRSRRAEGMWYAHRYNAWAPGWSSLKAGDIIEAIEWTPRWAPHGERWVCRDCGWLGDTDSSQNELSQELRWRAHEKARGACRSNTMLSVPWFDWRAPRRLPGTEGHRRIVSVRDELLGDITRADVVLEGFPGQSEEWFITMYCGGKPDPDRPVNRIEFEAVS